MRMISAVLIFIYAALLTIGLYFIVVEVNSAMKWMLVALVSVACIYSWFAAKSIYLDTYKKGNVELNLLHLLIVSLVTVAVREEPQAIYYVGVPSLFLLLGVVTLYITGRRAAS